MLNIKQIANYLIDAYEKYTGDSFQESELKLQKLMYYLQKESIIQTGVPLYENEIQGWIHGPVISDLRYFFDNNERIENEIEVDPKIAYIVSNVLEQYAPYAAWTLRDMTHEEISWKKSREGLAEDESGTRVISIEDIKLDAANARIYDSVWGMYIDEFESAE